MSGHIALGAPGALREYMIVNTDLYSKAPANQFATKLATGAGSYDDLQNWSFWVMDNWQMGNGQVDATAGGFLYGELETRYPEQVLLPRHLHFEMNDSADVALADASEITGETPLGTGETYQKWAIQIAGGTGRTLSAVWVYLKNDGLSYTVRLSADSGGSPDSSITTATITTSSARPGYAWYKCSTISQSITSAAYWISLEVATPADVPASTGGPVAKYYDGAAWQTTTSHFNILLNTEAYTDSNAIPRAGAWVAEVGGELYAIGDTYDFVYQRDTGTAPGWTVVGAVRATQILSLGGNLWIAHPNASYRMDEIHDVYALDISGGEGDNQVSVFAAWGGFVWAGRRGEVLYSADGTTWTGPITVGFDGESVTGIAGLGDYVYVSTEKELIYVGFGDEVNGAAVWGSPDARMGKNMMHYQGQLFIPLQESLLRFDGASMLPVGIDLGEGLPASKQGDVASLTSTNNWLIMGVNARDTASEGGSVWAWTTQGWHHIAHLPPTMQIINTWYRRNDQRLYIGCSTGHVFSLYLPDVARLVDTVSPEFAAAGWMETDWFFGGLKEAWKDCESVYVAGDNITAGAYVEIYWKDDDSTAWELLGTVTSDRQELRWDDYTTRPLTRQLKIGIALYTQDASTTPIVRAVRLKYHPMVSDWFRWSFPILVSDNQQEMGGTVSAHTASEKRSHLDGLITQVPPFILRDMSGAKYEVKVMACPIQAQSVEWYDGALHLDSIYNMTVEAIRPGEYEG